MVYLKLVCDIHVFFHLKNSFYQISSKFDHRYPYTDVFVFPSIYVKIEFCE